LSFEQPVAEVGGEPGRLPRHPLGSRSAAGNAVHGSREIQRFLDGSDLLMLARREDPRRITHGHPADRHRGARRQDPVDLDDPVDPHFGACPNDGSGEQGNARGEARYYRLFWI
jgi:hypothetical protein